MFAVIFIPNFSLQAVLRHEPELINRAVALTDPELAKLGIIQMTPAARDAGVSQGMSARCAELLTGRNSVRPWIIPRMIACNRGTRP